MSLNTFQISQCIQNKDYAAAESAIVEFIIANSAEDSGLSIPVKSTPLQAKVPSQEEVNFAFCNQFVTLITQLFSAPNYKPSQRAVGVFLSYKFVIDWLFSASMWNNTDALIDHLELIKTDRLGKVKFNKKRLTTLLMLISLGSKFKLPWNEVFKMLPGPALSAYISLVTQPIPALTKETNDGFNYLLETAKNLPILELPRIEDLGKLNYAFFSCSYATSPNKYEFKKWLTRFIRHNLSQWLSTDTQQYIDSIKPLSSNKKLPLNKKLKVAVMLERYSNNHAMYRCFNEFLKNLSTQFELIAYTDQQEIVNDDVSVFSKIIVLKDVFDVNENTTLVTQEKPDIVFYPSIGMRFWGIYLSQLRLAPMQIMMGGHPSSSFSPEIDYLVIPGDSYTAADVQPFFSEKIIMGDTPTQAISIHTMHDKLTPEFIAQHNGFINDDNEIKIGINGVLTKVTHTIINVCKQIQQRSSKKITFVFFSGHTVNQLAYLSSKKQLLSMLKHVELVSFTDYIAYMKTISECHFLLPTLPFGGSNSNIDAMILNKPKLFIKGDTYLYTRCDHWEWERVGLASQLGCDSLNELVDKSVHLIENNAYRAELHTHIVEKCTLEHMFVQNDKDTDIITHLFSKAIDSENEKINAVMHELT